MSRRFNPMTKANEELINTVDVNNIKCAIINHMPDINEEVDQYILKVNHTDEDMIKFLNTISFSYNKGYGTQEVDGIVWLKDGTWLSRWEYDGSEGWDLNRLPEIPKELR